MSVSEPGKIITPWAESGLKNLIPQAANPATGRAGFDQGFSAINMTAKEAGGIPPFGQDFNGIFYEVTNILRYMQTGGKPTFDAALATAIGGYPLGAVLIGDDGVSVFKNAVAGNETNPNTGGDGWARPDLQIMELYRRSYAEAGYNVVGAFRAGFTYVNANDVGIDETTGKGFTGPAGAVAAGTNPASGGFVDVSASLLRDYVLNTTTATFKNERGYSAVENMVTGRIDGVEGAVVHQVGNIYSTGGTTWEVRLGAGVDLGGGRFAQALTDVHVRDFVAQGDLDIGPRIKQALNASFSYGLNVILPISGTISTTVTIGSGQTIIGNGRSKSQLVWNGGDAPVFSARQDWTNTTLAGGGNIVLRDFRIDDRATNRENYYTIDLCNGVSNEIRNVHVYAQKGLGGQSSKYGAKLGRDKDYGGLTFLPKVVDCRIENAVLNMNTTDFYVRGNEIWGAGRDCAIIAGAGGSILDNQIVPGVVAGVLLRNDYPTPVDTMKINGNFFDGSYTDVYTGTGIRTALGVELVGAEIIGNNFWHLNEGALNLGAASNCNISVTCRDCDSDDTGDDDITMFNLYGNIISSCHFRSGTAPKTGANRINLGKPFSLTGKLGFPVNKLRAVGGFTSTYATGTITNNSQFVTEGSDLIKLTRSALPNAGQFHSEIVNVGGNPYFSDGTSWFGLSGRATAITTDVGFNVMIDARNYYISKTAEQSNAPSGAPSTASIMTIVKTGSIVVQKLTTILTAQHWVRQSTDSGATFTAWVLL